MKTDKKIIINIGRQLGSGGRLIGHHIARELGLKFYDKELLDLAVSQSGIDKHFFEKNDEEKGIFGTMYSMFTPLSSAFFPGDNQISQENLFKIQSEAIRKVAEEDSCVFVGRCADYVLRDNPNCLNIFISANEKDRIRRLCKLKGVNAHEAHRLLQIGDERRASYYNYYSTQTWGAASTYHLCVNSSVLGVERTTDFLKDFIKRRFDLE